MRRLESPGTYRLQGAGEGSQVYSSWSRLVTSQPGLCSPWRSVCPAALCTGQLVPLQRVHFHRASGHLVRFWGTRRERAGGTSHGTQAILHTPLARLGGKICFSLLCAHLLLSHPPFPNPPKEPGFPESNSQEGRGWPFFIWPHGSGDGEVREDNLILKISVL